MDAIRWWCAATAEPWTWSWRAYPGIWLAVLATAAIVWRARRHAPAAVPDVGAKVPAESPSPRTGWIVAGIVLLWLTLDWPVGPLGTGYLASVHALQFVLLGMVVPAMLLIGVDRDRLAARLARRRLTAAVLGFLMHPLIAAIGFTVVMGVTHVPAVVDALMRSQLGAMALDLAWLVSGVWLWWPVLIGLPERRWFPPPAHMLYLFFATQAHLLIAMWLLSSQYPVYATYELAPRVSGLSALEDQQLAGGIMIGIGGTLVLGAITVIFFRWASRHEAEAR